MTAPAIGSPEWSRLVTASKVAAILGLSPWESQFSIWHLMKGNIPPAPESRPMRRGTMLENACLDWWLADNPGHTETGRQVWRPLFDWGGATPDMDVIDETGDLILVDAKTTSSDDEWRDGIPAYYLASSLWQLACTPEAKRVHLAVLFGRPFDLFTFTIERDEDRMAGLVQACKDFYDTLAADDAPPLDEHPATYEAVRALHPDIDRDLTVELAHNLAHEYVAASNAAKAAADRERAAKTTLLDAMGRARLATFDGTTVARRQPRGDAVSLVRVAKYISPPAPEGKTA